MGSPFLGNALTLIGILPLTQQLRHPFFVSLYYTLIQPEAYHQHGHQFI